ncbi:MAG: RHS repeat-associated core domain-containing protein [Methylovulum sp.]|nr:RHS repeat-associated core domain-containing protein [Methylovulum sp.]
MLSDHLNTPRQVINASKQLRWQWNNSDPFGANAPDTNPQGLGGFAYNLRFPGQYWDSETGLFYNYFRVYDPKAGRYAQSDPIGLRGGLNAYAYVNNNPLTRIDPLGLDSVLIFQTEPDWQKNQSPDSWNNAASYAGGQALNSCENCSPNDIHVLPVTDVSQVNSALSSFSDITQIYFIGHSSSSSIYVGSQNIPNTNISNNGGANDISPSKLNWSNLKPGAAINILGCNAGKGTNSIAQQISNASGVATTAPNQFLNFDATGKPFFQPWRSGSFNTFFPNP